MTAETTVAGQAEASEQRAALPIGWDPRRTRAAQELVSKAQATMRGLARADLREETTSGPGTRNVVRLRLNAERDRKLYRSIFRWGAYRRSARWLGTVRRHGAELVGVALLDRGTPTWYRLLIEPRSGRVLEERLITTAHFIDHRYSGFAE